MNCFNSFGSVGFSGTVRVTTIRVERYYKKVSRIFFFAKEDTLQWE
jgi:hypothetical protein